MHFCNPEMDLKKLGPLGAKLTARMMFSH